MNDKQAVQFSPPSENLRHVIWLLGVAFWVFGMIDRSIASFSDGYLSITDIAQLLTVLFFFVNWLFLKPTRQLKASESSD